MRVLTSLITLLGVASAAPIINVGKVHKRQGPVNKPTVLQCGEATQAAPEFSIASGNFLKADRGKEMIIAAADIPPAKRDPVSGSLPLKLVNTMGGNDLQTYISGLDSDNRVVFLGADGQLIYPSSGGSGTPVAIDSPISIPMPAQGETLEITVPIALSSGRVYFSEGPLKFFMVAIANGDGLVQPSISDLTDSALCQNWGFVELTLTTEGVVWANISYVDFVGLIFSMTLNNNDNSTQEVIGLPADGVKKVCDDLVAQGEADGLAWGAGCLTLPDGTPHRVLSPEDAESIAGGAFDGYYDDYVNEVWELYKTKDLKIDTQKENGIVNCRVGGDDLLTCDGDNRGYPKPDADDIWGCNTGPFGILEGDNGVHLAVVPRLCAAFVRHTLTMDGGDLQPGPAEENYYKDSPNMHYSRIVHSHEIDGKGYAFAYDDVYPSGGKDLAGLVSSSNFVDLTFWVGGKPQ